MSGWTGPSAACRRCSKDPLELVNRRGVQRRLQLLADDRLVGIVDAVERAREHQPQGPRRRNTQQCRVLLEEPPEAVRPRLRHEIQKHGATVWLKTDAERG